MLKHYNYSYDKNKLA
jgi:hypothetical protein